MAGGRLVALPTGYKVGRYTLNAVLGEGGFGITYRARDEALRRDVAVKEYLPADVAVREDDTTIRPRSASDTQLYQWGLQRFVDEARTLAAMHAPNIVSVHDFMETNGTGYMVMELIEGRSLALILDREGPMLAERLMPITRQLLLGLEAVHTRGYLHRDIKPGNILIRPNGQPVLVDFGAARISKRSGTHAMTSVYTPGYAPAEQYAADGEQGPWTDIYALAATLYEAITGWPPPDATTRLLNDRMVPAAQAAAGRYPDSFLAGIDAGLGLRKEDRPPSVGVWRAMLFDEPMPADTDLSATRTDFPTVIAGQRSSKSGAVATPRSSQPGATPSMRPPAPAAPSQRQPSLRDEPPAKRTRWPLIAGAIAILLLGAGGGLLASGGLGLFDSGTEKRRQEADRRAAEERRQADLNAEAARLRAEEEARTKAAADEAERRRIEEAAARQRADEEAARARAAEEARRRATEEETTRAKAAAEDEARRKAATDEEARRRAADEAQRRAADDAQRRATDDAQRRAADEARRKADEEVARAKAAAEEARRRAAAEEEARRKAADDPLRRAQDEARRKAEEEARAKAAADEVRRRAAAEEERRRQEAARNPPPSLRAGDGRWTATAEIQTHARNRVCTASFTISGVATNGVLQASTTYGGPMVIRIGDDGLKAVTIAYDGRPVRTYWGNMRSTLVEFLDGCIYRITWSKQ